MRKFLLFLIIPLFNYSQVQIGQDINGEALGDQSGRAISISGDGTRIAIGARFNNGNGSISGHVRIYENINDVWTQIGNDIDGEASNDQSGISLSISNNGSIVAIGAPSNNTNGNGTGHVRVYENINGIWTQVGSDIDGQILGNLFGSSVSINDNGNILAVGIVGSVMPGYVIVYENINGIWTQVGSNINGTVSNGQFGANISLSSDGSIVGIGAPSANKCYVYENINGIWTQIGSDINGESIGDSFGSSLNLSSDGSIIAIGAETNDGNGNNSGHVRVYKNINNVWTQIGSDLDGKSSNSRFGQSVSISNDGNIIAIGGPENFVSKGYVRIYQNVNNVWIQIGVDINGDTFSELLGTSVSLSNDGSIVAIGIPGNNSSRGKVVVYNLSGLTLSLDEFLLNNLTIFPNPTSNILNLELNNNSELQKITIYNSFGQLISEENKIKINVSNYSKGLYFAEIETNKGKITKKFIVK